MDRIPLVERIRRDMHLLPPGERLLAVHVLDHIEEVPFLSSAELARQRGLSNATVTRLAQRLGYRGYVDLRRQLRTELRQAYVPGGPNSTDDFVAEYWRTEEGNLRVARELPDATMRGIADALASSRNVWMGGVQTMRPIAAYAQYMLGLFRSGVHLLVEDVRTHPESLIDVHEGDVAVIFTVRRYSKSTTRVGEAVVARGAQLALITDGGAPPLARIATHTLRLPTNSASQMLSVTWLLSAIQLITLLAAAQCGNARNEAAEEYLQRYEAFEY